MRRRWLLAGRLSPAGLCSLAGLLHQGGCSPSPSPSADRAAVAPAPPRAHPEPPAPTPDAALAPTSAPPDAPGVAIIDAPMVWSERRVRDTLAYRRAHSDPDATDLAIEPRVIVLHFTGGGSAKGTRAYFDAPRIEASRKVLARAGRVNVSAHYVIDRDGTIFRLQPETRFARHCIGLNHIAIGVENVGDEDRWPLTDAQVRANASLIRELARTHPISHLVGHHEVMKMREHALYRELDPAYGNRKSDPGPAFMAKVRAAVADLSLAGP